MAKSKQQITHLDFFTKLSQTTGNELAQAANLGVPSGDVKNWIDTGVLILNGQISGSLKKGCPDNKIVVFAGPEAVGKTFFVISIAKYFLESFSTGAVFDFETEGAVNQKMLEERGIDTSRFFVVPVNTVEEWKTQALKILKAYKETPEDERHPMMFILDSLGNLSTSKEVADSESGSDKKDMTRAGQIKAAFRTLTLKMSILGVPLLVTNHTYDEQGKMFAAKVQSGGSGVRYNNSITIFLSKAKDKEDDEVTGSILTCTLKKGRFTKENSIVKVKLNYVKGLDRYYGLLDLAEEAGIVKKISTKYEFPDGTKAFENHINKNPLDFWTPEIMEKLEVAANQKFRYGSEIICDEEDEEVVDE